MSDYTKLQSDLIRAHFGEPPLHKEHLKSQGDYRNQDHSYNKPVMRLVLRGMVGLPGAEAELDEYIDWALGGAPHMMAELHSSIYAPGTSLAWCVWYLRTGDERFRRLIDRDRALWMLGAVPGRETYRGAGPSDPEYGKLAVDGGIYRGGALRMKRHETWSPLDDLGHGSRESNKWYNALSGAGLVYGQGWKIWRGSQIAFAAMARLGSIGEASWAQLAHMIGDCRTISPYTVIQYQDGSVFAGFTGRMVTPNNGAVGGGLVHADGRIYETWAYLKDRHVSGDPELRNPLGMLVDGFDYEMVSGDPEHRARFPLPTAAIGLRADFSPHRAPVYSGEWADAAGLTRGTVEPDSPLLDLNAEAAELIERAEDLEREAHNCRVQADRLMRGLL